MTDTTPSPVGSTLRAAVAGALAAAVALATTALLDALSAPVPSLVNVVDQAIIRAAPAGSVRAAIEAVGTADKPLLTGGTAVLGLLMGACLGTAARRRRWIGDAAFGVFGLLGVLCAVRLGTVSVLGATVAAVTAVAVGIVALRALLGAAARDEADAPMPEEPAAAVTRPPAADVAADTTPTAAPAPSGPRQPRAPAHGSSRRHFLIAGSLAAGGAAVALAGAARLRRRDPTSAQRAAVRLPDPAERAPGTDAEAGDLGVEGLSQIVTPTRDFFRIDEALVVPTVDLATWRLRITGMVDAPLSMTYDDLLAQPLVERDITLSCVSNEVGGPLVGNARWLGVRLADLLERAGVRPGATQVVGRSVDRFTVGFPTAVALDGRDAMVALAQNGEPLTSVHGFPARLVVPGLYGYVSATKWLREIELTTWEAFDSYWVERGWAEQAPVKVQSRIDVPRDFSGVSAGARTAAGVAWAPRRGVDRVEVRVDGGPWREARLGPSLGDDAWRQWTYEWQAEPGNRQIEVRAATRDGEVQPEARHSAFPNGATGHHRVTVRVRS